MRRNPGSTRDSDIGHEIFVKDIGVHEAHNKLKLSGEMLGKTEYDIVVDILRQEGNLSEDLALPEFCVLTSDDLAYENYVGDAGRFIPQQSHIKQNPPNKKIFIQPSADTQLLKRDEVMIVFHVNMHAGKLMHEQEYVLKEPDRYAREQRRRAFAEAVNGRLLYLRDGPKFHYHTMSIHGVVIKKEDLEKSAALIQENPEKFRLGNKFYSREELEQNEEEFRENLRGEFKTLEPYGKRHNTVGEQMMEQIRDFYGPAAAAIARAEYENWLLTKED